LALTSPTGGGCSVGIVRSRTKAMEFSLVLVCVYDVSGYADLQRTSADCHVQCSYICNSVIPCSMCTVLCC
jgi:hypothetical protein